MKTRILILALAALSCAGCQNFKAKEIYPDMPPGSKFTRRITLPWGTTEVVYETAPAAKP